MSGHQTKVSAKWLLWVMTAQDIKADNALLCLMQETVKAHTTCAELHVQSCMRRVACAGVDNVMFPPGRTLEPQEGVAGAGRVQS